MTRGRILGTWILLAAVALLPACSGDDGGAAAPVATATATVAATATEPATPPPSTPTATPTEALATPVATPTATATSSGGEAGVAGLVVVSGDVATSSGDFLGAPPSEAARPGFERGLSHAVWRIEGTIELDGETAADGSFHIADLPPGAYDLELRKTLNGNLVHALVPLTVGTDGRAVLVVEIAPGQVRWTNTYTRDGVQERQVGSPNGTRLTIRDGVISEIDTFGRRYVDDDGDGRFEPGECRGAPPLWLCGDDDACGDGRVCRCVGSCPLCEDCPITVCVPREAPQPHVCDPARGCETPVDTCACVSSCPDCDDCAAAVCVASCAAAEIEGIEAYGPSRLFQGQSGAMSAVARLSDGWVIDVTHLVDWSSSNEAAVTVDAWGGLTAVGLGTASVRATLGDHTSEPWPVAVGERPALVGIHLQNASCFYPVARPEVGPGGASPPALPDEAILPPFCRSVVRVGASLHLFALGEFEGGHFEDLTRQVAWNVAPEGIGTVAGGIFTGGAVGVVSVVARMDGVDSNSLELHVVDRPTLRELQIYPLTALPRPDFPQPPTWFGDERLLPCYHCGYAVTVLLGDELPFRATAAYDTGEWEDVTERVAWSTTDPVIAPISAAGVLRAAAAGDASVTASLDGVDSNPAGVRIVESATLEGLSIHQDGLDRVVQKGDEATFHAFGYYDVGFSREVTDTVAWRSSDESVGGFLRPGVFVGRAAGSVEVWADLDFMTSQRLSIQVFETSDLDYCDGGNVNRAHWKDAFNQVTLETDCARYDHPEVASIRFTVTERERPFGIFDPCLDLYVYQGDRLVRTIREQGCGEPFLPPGSREFDDAAVRYQTLAFWDLKDAAGAPVAPGTYTIYGRFYLYYDPVVRLNVVVGSPDARIPCQQNECGNGCGYVHACGGTPPLICPTVCTRICECPGGWGITPEGDCLPCG